MTTQTKIPKAITNEDIMPMSILLGYPIAECETTEKDRIAWDKFIHDAADEKDNEPPTIDLDLEKPRTIR